MNSFQIPLKIEDIESLLDGEFLADFNNICFENINQEKQIETAFLYFRNTGLNFKPDFSNCSAEKIAEVLKTYISTEYDVPNKWLQLAWLQLVLRKLTIDVDIKIIPKKHILEVENQLKDIIDELAIFIISLPVYCLYLYQQDYIDDGSINKSNFSNFGVNLYNILQDSQLEELLLILQIHQQQQRLPLKFYNIYFQKSNIKLISIVKNIKQFGIFFKIFKLITNKQ